MDMSPTGGVCGFYPLKTWRNTSAAFRFVNSLQTYSNFRGASATITPGDLAFCYERSLYHEGTGIINRSDSLTGTVEYLNYWFNTAKVLLHHMTERGALSPEVPNFPALCESLHKYTDASRGFISIPKPRRE